MTGLALIFVVLSAFSHVSWNLLLKRSANREVFSWWMLASSIVILLPLGIVLVLVYPITLLGWSFVLGTVGFHVLYYLLLAKGYSGADLSVVYPIARGMGPALVPVLGVLILKETISPMAIAGILMVIAGIYAVYWWGRVAHIFRDPFQFLKERGVRFAVLTGLTIGGYSIWDKVGVSHVNPFLYMYLLNVGTVLILAPYMVKFHGRTAINSEWKTGAVSIVAAGLLDFLAYGLILTALTFSRVSYVAPAREVGIVVAVFVGTLVLKESFGIGRLLGSGMIVAGLALIALAP